MDIVMVHGACGESASMCLFAGGGEHAEAVINGHPGRTRYLYRQSAQFVRTSMWRQDVEASGDCENAATNSNLRYATRIPGGY